MRMVRLITSIVFFFSATQLFAQQYLSNNGKISFFSNAPMEDISAQNNKVSAIYDRDTKELVFQLNIIDFVFPNSLMQEHFNENYLESDIYPKSTFTGKIINQDAAQTTVEGDLTIHGKTNKVKVEGNLNQENNTVNISSSFIVMLEDYDIKVPKLVMFKIAEMIDVKVTIELKEIE